MLTDAAVRITGLTKVYKEFAIENLNLSIPQGYITGFVGRNGAGKTTTLKAVLNMIQFDGKIQVLGMDNRRHEQEVKNRIGAVLSEDGFIEDIPVARLIQIIRLFYSRWRDDTFEVLAEKFGVSMDKKVSELSRGMRVKLALAVALSHEAELFLLDEPTSGLDPIIREEILDLFMELIQDEKKTVLFSTHITSDLDKVADYIVLIEQGRIVFQQPKDELLETHAVIRGGTEELAKISREFLVGWKQNQFGFEALVKKERFLQYRDFAPERPNIEQIMTYYVRGIEHERD